ncbi:hypothetical protein MHPYR_60155 [uncultured Mycobacterium sp.]|uniref:Uncharacterized protein n=1 Tax=uncultured Mycobacterium sp. TaxID=171292 RepID=A0A1Y5PIU9_9MYCO|nr:hypothetical protein MHPYR_60155 [uncultured Mycobacterium sp.]
MWRSSRRATWLLHPHDIVGAEPQPLQLELDASVSHVMLTVCPQQVNVWVQLLSPRSLWVITYPWSAGRMSNSTSVSFPSERTSIATISLYHGATLCLAYIDDRARIPEIEMVLYPIPLNRRPLAVGAVNLN